MYCMRPDNTFIRPKECGAGGQCKCGVRGMYVKGDWCGCFEHVGEM